jgi:hypothetical protein
LVAVAVIWSDDPRRPKVPVGAKATAGAMKRAAAAAESFMVTT